jgi:hypothetical protein
MGARDQRLAFEVELPIPDRRERFFVVSEFNSRVREYGNENPGREFLEMEFFGFVVKEEARSVMGNRVFFEFAKRLRRNAGAENVEDEIDDAESFVE